MPQFPIIKNSIYSFYLVKNTMYTLVSVSLCRFLYGFYTAAIGPLLVPIGATFNTDIGQEAEVVFWI